MTVKLAASPSHPHKSELFSRVLECEDRLAPMLIVCMMKKAE
jgi:hypothetical protein